MSETWEEAFFRAPLKKREALALKARCESYQDLVSPSWSADIFHGYSCYFGFLTALKVKSILCELQAQGYLKIIESKPIRLFDFGAGTLGAGLGAFDFFGNRIREWSVFDRDPKPIQWAQENFQSLLPFPPKILMTPPESIPPDTIFIAADVWNEWERAESGQATNQIYRWLETVPDSSLVILIEPASKAVNQRFLKLRDDVLPLQKLLLPCPHLQSCPALKQGEWCHEDRPYQAPSAYWNLVHSMNFERASLTFSHLVFGGQSYRFSDASRRFVSRPIVSKGKVERWICGRGERWKASVLKRHRSDENEHYFSAPRGCSFESHVTEGQTED